MSPDSSLKPSRPVVRPMPEEGFVMPRTRVLNILILLVFIFAASLGAWTQPMDLSQRYLLLATTRTSTMQKELNEAAAAGYRVLGGAHQTGDEGDGELMVLLEKVAQPPE